MKYYLHRAVAKKPRDLEKLLCNLIGKSISRVSTVDEVVKKDVEFGK